MFIQNHEELLKLARNDTEKQVINLLLSSINDTIAFAQPSSLMSESIHFDSNFLKVQGDKYDLSSYDNFYLISFGKASQTMAKWMLDNFPVSFSRIIIVSPDEIHSRFKSTPSCRCFKGGHPFPNEQSVSAAEEVISLMKHTSPNDLCIFLISGGGSALLESPDFSISLDDYLLLQKHLLSCGANIHEINTVRKHFSKIKGGKVSAISQTNIISFIISDVIGNDPSFIASGPTVPDKTTWNDCKSIFFKYNSYSHLPNIFTELINQGVDGFIVETPSDPLKFQSVFNYVIGDNLKLLEYLKKKLECNYLVEIVDYQLNGEASKIGKEALFKYTLKRKSELGARHEQFPYSLLLYGGETTVTLSSSPGVGGRNQELALGFAISLQGSKSIFMASFGTDGIDGNSNAAGAIVGSFTITNDSILNDAIIHLNSNNANTFFKKYGGEILTGYTGTNLMDIIIICFDNKD